LLIIVDVLASTGAFIGTVCLIVDREGNRVEKWIKEAIHISKSMNRDEGSYQLSHIYDILFAPKLSSERLLDRLFRRRLQSKPKRQQ